MDENAIERLQAKSPEEAIIEQIGRDFNLAPFMVLSLEKSYRAKSHKVVPVSVSQSSI